MQGDVLVTGFDIIFFWVARMIMTGLELMGEEKETLTDEEIEKRVECDIFYIDNWSIWFDIRIIAKTVLVIFRDAKAY